MTSTQTKPVVLLCLALFAVGSSAGCKEKDQPAKTESESNSDAKPTQQAKPAGNPKPTISKIVARARTWGPTYTNWYGKQAPDFTVTDLSGKKHTLSEYKGRNVMLTFWATWCGPCIYEIPHLIELRDSIGEDKLTMLSIAYIGPRNSTEEVKQFITRYGGINYPVVSTTESNIPRPYNLIRSIPCSFFIDPQGKIKLATEGVIPLPEIKAILEAER